MSETTIIEIRPQFSEFFDNQPDFEVRVSREPQFGPYDERQKLYIAQDGPILNFFTWSGKPDNGFGGWRRTIELKAGGALEVIGGWSSGASSVSSVYPELLCVEASYTPHPWGEHCQRACGLLVEPLVDWYLDHQHEVDWGIYLFETASGPAIVPSMGRFVKPMDGAGKWEARLLPLRKTCGGDLLKPLTPEYRALHRAHFIDATRTAWAKVAPFVDPLGADQRAAVTA